MRTRDPFYELEKTDAYQTLTTKFDKFLYCSVISDECRLEHFRTLAAEFSGKFYYLFIKRVK